MSNTKNELILNPDYYRADTYVNQGENQQAVYIRVFIQVLIAFIVISILIFSYKYFMKNYYEDIYLWVTEDKVTAFIKEENAPKVKREPIIIREESLMVKFKEQVVTKAKVVSTPKIKPQTVEDKELTDEYVKLVQESLGNY